jgi:hypothetical protein
LYLEYLCIGISIVFAFPGAEGKWSFGFVRGGDSAAAADFNVQCYKRSRAVLVELLRAKYQLFDGVNAASELGDCLRSLASNPPAAVPPRRSARLRAEPY